MKKPIQAVLAALLVTGMPLCARAIPAAGADAVPAVAPDVVANSVEMREFQLHNARLPGPFSAHQDVTAWQITQGSWNGQSLEGLCLVVVHSSSDDGRSPSQTNAYVSEFATSAQRRALMDAFSATHPQAISSGVRVEPAAITLQLEGQTVVLHLGLIA